jgi:hypothetical protein
VRHAKQKHAQINLTQNEYTVMRSNNQITIKVSEVCLLMLTFAISLTVVMQTASDMLYKTILFTITAIIGGFILAKKTELRLGSRGLNKLALFWLIKIILISIILYFGWLPEITKGLDEGLGYDPARFYDSVVEIVQGNLSFRDTGNNYTGILYYYSMAAHLFGLNTYVPAILNAFMTFAGTLILISLTYTFIPEQKKSGLQYLIFIPEVIWFDVMTSRETIIGITLSIVLLALGSMILKRDRNLSVILVIFIGIWMIMTIRTVMLIPVLICGISYILIARPSRPIDKLIRMTSITLLCAAIFIGPKVQSLIGGYDIDYLNLLRSLTAYENNIANTMEWSENSIGRLIAPNSVWSAILAVPVRTILYLAAPLPHINVSIDGISSGNYIEWQNLFTSLTAGFILMGFPYVLAASLYAWRNRRINPTLLIIPLGFYITLLCVSGGNFIIHERYRIMFDFMLFINMWMGYTVSSISLVKGCAIIWYGILCAFLIIYIVMKSM